MNTIEMKNSSQTVIGVRQGIIGTALLLGLVASGLIATVPAFATVTIEHTRNQARRISQVKPWQHEGKYMAIVPVK